MKKSLHIIWALTMALLVAACGDDDESDPAMPDTDEPADPTACITVLDQWDEPMEGCVFDYQPNPDFVPTSQLTCDDDGKFIADEAGDYTIPVKCGGLSGTVSFQLRLDEHQDLESRLVGSFCSDDSPFVIDREHPELDLQADLGWSSDIRCANWFSGAEITSTTIVERQMECSGLTECDPLDGRDILTLKGEPGESLDGTPIHLTLVGHFELLNPGEEVTIWVRLREETQDDGSGSPDLVFQELDLPILVRDYPSSDNDGGI